LSKHKLLLADDSITIQKVVNLTFADEGIEVISVGDGNSAMEKFAEIKPDLVMADINMPGLTGYEICERIKQDEETRAIPVILLVGSFEPFDEDEAKRVGADAFLTKPFQSIQQLVTKVSDLLDGKSVSEVSIEDEESEASPESFEETLEYENESPKNFADTEMDDQMIQADAVGEYAYDDTQSFEYRSAGDSPMELDEANLLELPSRDYFLETLANQRMPGGETVSPADAETEETGESEPGETEENVIREESAPPANLSPEMIDAIAAKVMEKISDKVIREIAWEVVPKMSDLIVKRMAEEKQEE
jgi:CheY-like chemotaxis protein